MDSTITAAAAAMGMALSACASPTDTVRVAHLDGDSKAGFAQLRADFERRNPGYGLDWLTDVREWESGDAFSVGFVQAGVARAEVTRADGSVETATGGDGLTTGDVVLLRPGERMTAESGLAILAFDVPTPIPDELPAFIRPDYDPGITDTPGGCAEETGAYRRILLTWLPAVGPYVYHALNCHRVRIQDSFAHYHPHVHGFDEFYLVQMTQPGAVLYTSERTDEIIAPETVTREGAADLLDVHELRTGDLVYMPRGTVHRGYGGVLAQVITVPGFRPGAEIGVDHHLRAINERLGLSGDDRVPYREASSDQAVVK